jgi:hypothetical protein
MRRCVGVLFVSAALLAPVALAQDRDHDRRDQRYYDAERHDYHNWGDREDRAYRHWLEERHERYRDWARANRRQQRDFWKWYHEHPDWDRR